MKAAWFVLMALLAPGVPADAQISIFADGFEMGCTCFEWSQTVGGNELCYDVPYGSAPPVAEDRVHFTPAVQRADVVFAMDSTGSMGGEVANLQSSIASLIEAIEMRIPDSAFAVAGYEDYPYGSYGSLAAGDSAFYLLHRAMTASSEPGLISIIAAVNLYQTRNGADTAESGWEMVFQVATGAGSGTGTYAVPPFDSASAPPLSPPEGEEIGVIGGVGIRSGSVPIIVWITDAPSHESDVTWIYDYGLIPGVTPHSSTQALSALENVGGRIIGVLSGEGGRADLEFAAEQSRAMVAPDAWGIDARPPGCTELQCCTGINGTGISPNGNDLCPLVFDISSDGTGLGQSVVDGIDRLLTSGVLDVGTSLVDDPGDAVNAPAAFVDRLEADAAAPLPCAQGLVAVDTNSDGVPDTLLDVEPGTTPCFDLVLKTNVTVPSAAQAQVFPATLEFIGDGVTVLDTRKVFFRVLP